MDTECLCSDLPVFYSVLVGTTAENAGKKVRALMIVQKFITSVLRATDGD